MKRKLVMLIMVIMSVALFTSCSNPIDNPLNGNDFEKVKVEISSNDDFSPMKKKYIIDNLADQLGMLVLVETMGKTMNKDISELKIPTFREEIDELIVSFDSIRSEKIKIAEDNKKLGELIELVDATTVSLGKYKGHLIMDLKFNNQFEKEILYIILNYKYVNKYDTEYFNVRTKLTDEVAEDFKGEITVSTTEKYNDVADFMFSKVPVQANKILRDELGDEVANKKVKRDFLMTGLKVETLWIVFKDKTKLTKQDAEWEYFDKN